MSDFSELIAKYEVQGYSYDDAYHRAKRYMYNHGRHLEQKKIRDVIKQLEIDDPVRYRQLVWDVEYTEEAAAAKREERARQLAEQARLEELKHFKFDHGLVVAGVPNIDFSGVEGMIAFRAWNISPIIDVMTGELKYALGSTVMRSVWKPQMIADRIPTADNNSGLYCVKLDPLGLMTRAASYFGEVCGLLELRGKVLEHTDGVVRAEWAKIICVFIQAGKNTENIYGGLRWTYPTVSMYVLHKEQIAEVLLRVTVLQSMR